MEPPAPYLRGADWQSLGVFHPFLYLYLGLSAASVVVVAASGFEPGQLGRPGSMDPLLDWEAPEAADVSVFSRGRVRSLTCEAERDARVATGSCRK